MSVCKPAEENGVYVLHGNRGSFHTDKQPAFKAIYSSIKQVMHYYYYFKLSNQIIFLSAN